jgi:carboxylesterase
MKGVRLVADRHCLLLHGFTGGPYEVLPLAEHLQRLGFICHVPTLPGHEDDLSGLRRTKWMDWLESAAAEAEQLTHQHGPIDVIGFSMGGLISMYLANRFPIRRLVLLSAAAIYVSPARYARDLAYRIRIRDFDHMKKMKQTPFRAALQFMKLARFVKKQELPRITVRTLIVQGQQDQIVHPHSAKYIFRRLQGEREIEWLAKSTHMICLSEEAPLLFNLVERFLHD